MTWDRGTLGARIRDPLRRTRHEAGSPNPEEVRAYDRALPSGRRSLGVVLGMTPELRTLALARFDRVVSLDISELMIDTYREWVRPGRERVVQADWRELAAHVADADAVLTDGGFPNLPDVDAIGGLLATVRGVLRPGGRLVTRHPVVPRGLDVAAERQEELVRRHRAGELDAAEFGFAVRLLGHLGCCWDGTHLDNARLFDEVDATAGLSREEREAIARYVFRGRNVLLAAERWEALLREAGFSVRLFPLTGRDWYRYYRVYAAIA